MAKLAKQHIFIKNLDEQHAGKVIQLCNIFLEFEFVKLEFQLVWLKWQSDLELKKKKKKKKRTIPTAELNQHYKQQLQTTLYHHHETKHLTNGLFELREREREQSKVEYIQHKINLFLVNSTLLPSTLPHPPSIQTCQKFNLQQWN